MAASTTIAPPAPRAGPGDILIYAELLTNLRQITVKASLPTPADQTTKVQILDLGHKFRIEHHGVIRELHLPAQAPIAGALPTSHKGSVDLTWRVPVRPQEAQKRHFVPESQPLPWTAADIRHDTAIACRNCDSCFVEQGKVNAWKDLPSENWAEMMEFWHCHKPVDHTKPEDDGLQQRGYGAANTITAQEGVGFVDMTSLLFHESDCQNLLVSSRALLLFSSFSLCQQRGTRRWPSRGSRLPMPWTSIQFPKINFNLLSPLCGQSSFGVPSLRDGLLLVWLLLQVFPFHLGV